MDAKSKANFINSVASGEGTPCPRCNAINKADSSYCIACGAELAKTETVVENSAPAFSQVSETKVEQSKTHYVEPESIFAQGLPSWSIEPPQIMVRRHK